jgi:hypothetical protein
VAESRHIISSLFTKTIQQQIKHLKYLQKVYFRLSCILASGKTALEALNFLDAGVKLIAVSFAGVTGITRVK